MKAAGVFYVRRRADTRPGEAKYRRWRGRQPREGKPGRRTSQGLQPFRPAPPGALQTSSGARTKAGRQASPQTVSSAPIVRPAWTRRPAAENLVYFAETRRFPWYPHSNQSGSEEPSRRPRGSRGAGRSPHGFRRTRRDPEGPRSIRRSEVSEKTPRQTGPPLPRRGERRLTPEGQERDRPNVAFRTGGEGSVSEADPRKRPRSAEADPRRSRRTT